MNDNLPGGDVLNCSQNAFSPDFFIKPCESLYDDLLLKKYL